MRILVVGGLLVLGAAIALLVMLRRAPAPIILADTQPTTHATPPHAETPRAAARVTTDAAIAAEISGAARDELAKLQRSGSGAESWDRQGLQLLDSIAHGGVEISDEGCFIAGCGAAFTFHSAADYRRRIAELAESPLYHAWRGGKLLTPPEARPDGTVMIALVLYRPD